MTTYTITMIENDEGIDELLYGKKENVNHVLKNSDSHLFTFIETKDFNNKAELLNMLEICKEDFTGCEDFADAEFIDCDNNTQIEKTVIIYDYNETVYNLLNEWFQAKDGSYHKLNKDEKGYYIVTGINLFNPNKLYMTENDAKENHAKQYLQMKLNEMQNDKSNWIVKEVITETEFNNRCTFLDRNSKVISKIFN